MIYLIFFSIYYLLQSFKFHFSFQSQYHLDKTGVSVNAVCPGRTDTTLFHDFPKGSIDEESAKKHYAKSKPIR